MWPIWKNGLSHLDLFLLPVLKHCQILGVQWTEWASSTCTAQLWQPTVTSVLAERLAPSLQHAKMDRNQSCSFFPSPGILSSFWLVNLHSLGSRVSCSDVLLGDIFTYFDWSKAHSSPFQKKGSAELQKRNMTHSLVRGCSEEVNHCCSEVTSTSQACRQIGSLLGVHVCSVGNEWGGSVMLQHCWAQGLLLARWGEVML